jgi:hypothetical protein
MHWPRLDTCPDCGEPVLKARHAHQGRPFTLEPIEILPLGRCGFCHGKGWILGDLDHVSGGHGLDNVRARPIRGRVTCQRCNGTGQRGERLNPDDHVLVNAAGIARPYRDGKDRRPGQSNATTTIPRVGGRVVGEAAHRRHHCTRAAVGYQLAQAA